MSKFIVKNTNGYWLTEVNTREQLETGHDYRRHIKSSETSVEKITKEEVDELVKSGVEIREEGKAVESLKQETN